MTSVAPARFIELRDRYWKWPHLPVKRADLQYLIAELDREYFLHDHERKLSRRWLGQRDKAEDDIDALIALLWQCHGLLTKYCPDDETTLKVEKVVNAGSERSRRLALR